MSRQKLKNRRKQFQLFFFCFLLTILCFSAFVDASEKWPGIDEAVVKKYAKEYGREAKEPLINTDQGDLLLFVFLLAGAVGGFVAGYYWRSLMTERPLSPFKNESKS
jgi:hypothetical protein